MRGATSERIKLKRSATNFNPRTPCGVRPFSREHGGTCPRFQSTHPVRGATRRAVAPGRERVHFNPRTPCGVRLTFDSSIEARTAISIHAPRAGCDRVCGDEAELFSRISIHAPRAGCDSRSTAASARMQSNFNPRTPCGVRRAPGKPNRGERYFNPRTPCGVRRQTCTTWFAPIFATLPNQMYVCLHYTCFTTLFQPKTWFSAVFQRCEAPRKSMFASASHRVKESPASCARS